MKKLEGLIAAAHTPFNADGSVNLALVKKQAETLSESPAARESEGTVVAEMLLAWQDAPYESAIADL